MLAYAMRRRDAGDETAVLTGPLLTDSERWLAERPSDVTVEESRFISVNREYQDLEERKYRTLFEDSLARTLTLAAQRADDATAALLLAVEALERSTDPAVDLLVRSCLHRMGRTELEHVPEAGYEQQLRRTANRIRLPEWAERASRPLVHRAWNDMPLDAGRREHQCAHRRAWECTGVLGAVGSGGRRAARRPGRDGSLHGHGDGAVPGHRGR
ncbi:hypothetical protein SMD44_08157 [Streptomyces alboflavus]|uniref:Uncharacterized protein n=1 Tax=Streptomyces alboflavus TaxID=67267 RepID=A0A1Z1WQI0_9ACTN|nr:hypothetical protein [Streptomyces alboflavus]ARX88670.1 hypothetical protein SMD44_08157 [Streptomyces alboflavus]